MELWKLSAHDLAAGYRAGSFSPREALESVLARIAERDGEINAIATLDAEGARTAADAALARLAEPNAHPLCGVPITVKDLIFTRGLRTTAGSRLHEHFVPDVDAATVARLRARGAAIVGKTTTSEFGHKLAGDSELFGLTRNPHDPSRTSGGSSGGAAAALAAGFGPLALATDAVGSIRVPAAFCGVIGIKATVGLVPRAPGFAPSWPSLANTGAMARTVADTALLLEAILGYDGRDAGSLPLPQGYNMPTRFREIDVRALRVGFAATFGTNPVDPEVAAAIADAVSTLRASGIVVHDVAPDFADAYDTIRTIGLSEVAASRSDDTPELRERLDATFVRILSNIPARTAIEYVRANGARAALTRAMHALFQEIDVLVTPSAPIPAFAAGAIGVTEIAGVPVDEHMGWSPFSYPWNLTGAPALSIPTRLLANGLPIGLQLVGRHYEEATILSLAAHYEQALAPRSLIAGA